MLAILYGFGLAALALLCVYQDLFFAPGFRAVMAFELLIIGTFASVWAREVIRRAK